MKLKAICCSLALFVLSTSAHAVLDTTGGNVGFTMVDKVNSNSWTVDLGFTWMDLNDGVGIPSMIDILGELAVGGNDTAIGDITQYQWSMIGGISNNLVATTNNPFTYSSPADLGLAIGAVGSYWNNNGNGTNEVLMGGVGYYDAAGSYQGDANGFGGGADNFELDTGETALYYYFTGGNPRGGIQPSTTELGEVTFTADGYLVFGGAQPIPVPAAVWFLGSALIGMVGFARKRNSQAV